MKVETYWDDWGDDCFTINVYVDGVLKFTSTGDDEAELAAEAQEWLDDEYPDNEVVI